MSRSEPAIDRVAASLGFLESKCSERVIRIVDGASKSIITLVRGRTLISINDIFTGPPRLIHSWAYPILPKYWLLVVNVCDGQPRLPSLLDDLQAEGSVLWEAPSRGRKSPPDVVAERMLDVQVGTKVTIRYLATNGGPPRPHY